MFQFPHSNMLRLIVKEMEKIRDAKVQALKSCNDTKQNKKLLKKSGDRHSLELPSPVTSEIEASISVDKSPEVGAPPILKRSLSSRRVSIW